MGESSVNFGHLELVGGIELEELLVGVYSARLRLSG